MDDIGTCLTTWLGQREISVIERGSCAPMTLAALCDCSLDWLLGRRPSTPWHLGPPEPETRELVPVLAGLCQAGFATLGSQPWRGNPGFEQRPFVEMVCDARRRGLVQRVASQLRLCTDIVRWTADVEGEPRDVTYCDGVPCTRLGPVTERHYEGVLLVDEDARNAWGVYMTDPRWDRPGYLWEAMERLAAQAS